MTIRDGGVVRLFLACELSHETRRAVSRAVQSLAAHDRDVRWVGPERMHLTIKFLGEVADRDVPAVIDAGKAVAAVAEPFDLTIDRLGCFPPVGSVRVIWAGGGDAPKRLTDLVSAVESRFEALGFAPERRAYSAHVTLGRVKFDRSGGRLRGAVEATPMKSIAEHVASLTLFESRLSPRGPTYVSLARFPLGRTEGV